MKTVKILSLTLLMSIFCAGMMYAQSQQGRNKGQKTSMTTEQRASKQVEAMQKSLNLTPDQVTKLKAVRSQFAKDQAQLRTSKQGAQQDMKAKREAYDAQVKSILTPEQYQKYQDQHKNMMKKGKADQGSKVNKGVDQVNKDASAKKAKWNKNKRKVKSLETEKPTNQ